MELVISNETGSALDVYWGKLRGVGQAHHGVIAPHSEKTAADPSHAVTPLDAGEKVWIRGIADDGRVAATSLVIDRGVDNTAHLMAQELRRTEELTLPEEVLELALDDNGHLKGITREHLGMALFVAALFELEQRDRLRIRGSGIDLQSSDPTGDRVLDLVLGDLSKAEQPPVLEELLLEISLAPERYYDAVVSGLVSKGILHPEESRLMWLIPSWALRPANTVPETHLVRRLLNVLAAGSPGDARAEALITIINCCFDTPRFVEEELLAEVEQRIYEVSHKDIPVLSAVRKAVADAMTRKAMVYAAYPDG